MWSACHKATAWHKHRINTSGHPCLKWDSNPQSQCSSKRRHFIYALNRAATVISVTVLNGYSVISDFILFPHILVKSFDTIKMTSVVNLFVCTVYSCPYLDMYYQHNTLFCFCYRTYIRLNMKLSVVCRQLKLM